MMDRRRFLRLGAGGLVMAPATAWIFGCRPSEAEACGPQRPAAAQAACGATEANIEGPYYRDGAPFRADLVDAADVQGTRLVITGRVTSLDCRSALPNAVLDVWQADGGGHYDNDGSLRVPQERFRMRGKLRADASGAFSLKTIVPGRYLNGRVYRPSHIHVKVSAPGHKPLTTQLYFPGDPYNDVDPFIRRSLIMDVSRSPAGQEAHYNFVLTPA